MSRIVLAAFLLLFLPSRRASAETPPSRLPADKIAEVLQHEGVFNQTRNVLKVQWSRNDAPAAQRVSFQVGKRSASIMTGELALLAREVNPVLAALVDRDIAVTSLHTKLLDDNPRIYFLHFDGDGDPVLLAAAVREALEAARKPVAPATMPAWRGGSRWTTPIEIEQEVELPCGCTVGNDMDVGTKLSLWGDNEVARLDGDIACPLAELQPVLKALTASHVPITSIANHMELDLPHLIYVHVSTSGRPEELKKTIQPALEVIRSVSGQNAHPRHHPN